MMNVLCHYVVSASAVFSRVTLAMLVGISVSAASTIDFSSTLVGTVDNDPGNLEVRLGGTFSGGPPAEPMLIDTATGEYSGTYAFAGAGSLIKKEIKDKKKVKKWLLKKGWIVKYFIELAAGESSLWESSGFLMTENSTTNYSEGDIVTVTDKKIEGTATNATVTDGSFAVTSGDASLTEADPIISVATFNPAGPGLISFTTEHSWDDGHTATTSGTIELLGNPTFELPGTRTLEQTMNITTLADVPFPGSEPGDGGFGRLTGRVFVPEPGTLILLVIGAVCFVASRSRTP